MANETTLTTLNDLIAPIVQEAMFVASETSIMPGLVKNFAIANNTGKVLQVPYTQCKLSLRMWVKAQTYQTQRYQQVLQTSL